MGLHRLTWLRRLGLTLRSRGRPWRRRCPSWCAAWLAGRSRWRGCTGSREISSYTTRRALWWPSLRPPGHTPEWPLLRWLALPVVRWRLPVRASWHAAGAHLGRVWVHVLRGNTIWGLHEVPLLLRDCPWRSWELHHRHSKQ